MSENKKIHRDSGNAVLKPGRTLKKILINTVIAIVAVFIIIYVIIPCAAIDLHPDKLKNKNLNGRIRIEYWEKWTGGELESMQKLVDKFNNSQNRIFVEMLSISDVNQRFLVSVAGGNAPDLAGIWSSNVPVFGEMGALYKMNDLAAKYGIKKEDYIDAIWRNCAYGDDLYAMPTTPSALALHYNKRLFREAGLDPEKPPRTIAELDAMAEKITKYDENGRIKVLGFTPTSPGWWEWSWGQWFGGALCDDKEKIFVNSKENIAAYKWYQSYSLKYGVEKLQTFESGFGNFSSVNNPFISEQIAMELQGPWMHELIAKYKPEIEWGVAPFPSAVEGLDNVAFVDSDILVIPSDAKNPDEAFEFLAFLQKQENMEELCLLQTKFSPLKKVSDEFWKNHKHPFVRTFYNLAQSPNAHIQPDIPMWRLMMDEMHTAVSDMWLQRETPEAALNKAQERIDREWQKELIKIKKRSEVRKLK